MINHRQQGYRPLSPLPTAAEPYEIWTEPRPPAPDLQISGYQVARALIHEAGWTRGGPGSPSGPSGSGSPSPVVPGLVELEAGHN